MNYRKITGLLLLLSTLSFIIFFSACNELLDRIVWPRNQILSVYESPKLNLYKIRSIALLPMAPDDTTDNGTFFATNHFLNSLKQNFPNTKFIIPLVDSILTSDTLVISKIIDSIEKLRRLDLKYFFDTDIGYAVDEDSTDAMIIGVINKVVKKKGYTSSRTHYGIQPATLISCQFTYYLISLKDGRVLWKSQVLGEEGYSLNSKNITYPPLDYAVSNGIDKLINIIPLTDIKLE
ncbi:MAG: hypothetical protein NTZ27_03985 [Ignavibacteriales bacterium]|nr:hypothetical protein [Ignavibacteriales bacterium]